MKKVLVLFLVITFSASLLLTSVSAASSVNTDIDIYAKLKLYFNGVEDTSGKDGQFYNGISYVPKAMIYENTTYVPLRYFANMLGVAAVSWDPEKLEISVGSAPNDNVASQDNTIPQTNISSLDKTAIKMTRYVNIFTGANIQPVIDEDHKIIVSIEEVYYYPQLTLIFNGVKDTSGKDGMMNNGSNEVPKALIYKQNTYVPLRLFSNQMGIPNNEIVFDKSTLSMIVGNKKGNSQSNV